MNSFDALNTLVFFQLRLAEKVANQIGKYWKCNILIMIIISRLK